GDTGEMPAIDLKLEIKDGTVKYPDIRGGISKIFTRGTIAGDLDNIDGIEIDIPEFRFLLDGEPFEARVHLENLESDPRFDGKIKGKLDLNLVHKLIPMEGVQELGGQISTDLEGKASFSQIQSGNINDLDFGGVASVDQLIYDVGGQPSIRIRTADVDLTPRSMDIKNLVGEYGKSDFTGTVSVENFLALVMPETTMKGSFDLQSNNLDINQLLTYEEEGMEDTAEDSDVFDRFDFEGKLQASHVKYDVYPLNDISFSGKVTPNEISVSSARGLLGKSDFTLDGTIKDVYQYLYQEGEITGNLNLHSKTLDLNEYREFGNSPTAKTISNSEESMAVQIPDRTNIKILANIDKLYYEDFDLSNARGQVNLKDQAAELKNVTMNGLGGKMSFDGKYDTKDNEHPRFDLNYSLNKVEFRPVYKYLNTFKLLAPIGEYIDGNFDSSMSFSGTLDKNLNPVIDDLTADGFLQTFNAILKSFPPLEKIGDQLNLNYFKSIPLKGSKNFFEIRDGKLLVKDIKQTVQDIDLLVNGSHGLNSDMDYYIKAKIPRDKFRGQVASEISKGIGLLGDLASKAGLDISQGAFINLGINLTGSLKSPRVSFKVLGSDGETTFTEEVVTTVKETVKEAVDSVKTTVTEKVDEEKAALKEKMDKEVEAVMKLAEKQAEAARAAGKRTADQTRQLANKQADKLVKDAGNNFLKKKAAELAADKLREQADKKANEIQIQANQRADDIMAKARKKADDIKAKYGDL
ncbi:MAG: hypothetical protein HKN16_13740, partial [Saprospiraceae bacterium]|nr:hypothetical protein [Saprospiraceae bacterium]